uniref:Transcription factor Adf-1-like n=1 Tax=Poecilia reticulata TaxID=8081 RepID=A0A3P9P666_POERE
LAASGKMEDKLILAVFNYPELYNVTLPNYRCTESRINAWRNISMALAHECKRKWKNLRDRYLKEVRMELKGKKQGEFVQSKWKYRQLMNFIAPFTGSRVGVTDICGNSDNNPDHESVSAEGDATLSESTKTSIKVSTSPSEQKAPLAFVTQLPALSQDTELTQLAMVAKMPPVSQITPTSTTGRKRTLLPETPQSTDLSNKWPVKEGGGPCPAKMRQDEDELFLLSFVPALKRLAPQKRCETKMKIQQLMYEAEFNVQEKKAPQDT